MNKQFTYKIYTPEYKDRVIDLLDGLWHFPREEKLAYFKWKYEDNPYTESPMCFIALDGEKVVSFRGLTVFPLRINGQKYLTAQASDMVTDPEYRRMGLFQSVSRFGIDFMKNNPEFVVSMNTSSGGPTGGGHIKNGYKSISEREYRLRFTLTGLFNKLRNRPLKFHNVKVIFNSNIIVINTTPNLDAILSLEYKYDKATHDHSKTFYNWRLNNPKANYKYAYYFDTVGNLVAYIIFQDLRGARYDIIDFNYSDVECLRDLLNSFCRTQNPFFVSIFSVNKSNVIFRNQLKFKFLPFSRHIYKIRKFQKPPFLILKLSENFGDEIYKNEYWDLYKIISDEV